MGSWAVDGLQGGTFLIALGAGHESGGAVHHIMEAKNILSVNLPNSFYSTSLHLVLQPLLQRTPAVSSASIDEHSKAMKTHRHVRLELQFLTRVYDPVLIDLVLLTSNQSESSTTIDLDQWLRPLPRR